MYKLKLQIHILYTALLLFGLSFTAESQTAPILLNAETSSDGKTIELSFDKNMADPNGQESSFSLDIASTISSIYLNNSNPQIIILELDNRVHYGQSVSITYIQGNIQAEDGALLLDFTESITNKLIEPPTLTSAQSNNKGSSIELSFNKPMKNPSGKEQQFTVNGSSMINILQISLKAGDEKTMVLTLESNIIYGETVHVSYHEGDIASSDNGLLDAFDNEFVQNNVVEPPKFVSAASNTQGNKIELLFNKNMADPNSNITQFTVSNGTNQPIENIELKNGDASIIILTMQQKLDKEDVITVSYEQGDLESADGGILNSFSYKEVINNIKDAPILLAAESSEDGLSLELAFDQKMIDPSGEQSSFSISHSGGNSITKVELKQESDSLFTMSLQNAIPYGETVSISYVQGNIKSKLGVLLNSFTDSSVVNNVKESTSLSETYLSQSVSVFPNPSNGTFKIKTNGLFEKAYKLNIINLQGKIIQSKQIDNTSSIISIDLDKKGKGVYFIKLNNEIYQIIKKILIK